MAIQSTFDLEPEEPRKKVREEQEDHSDHSRPKIVQIGPVVRALEQVSCMQSEREQTLTCGIPTNQLVRFPLTNLLMLFFKSLGQDSVFIAHTLVHTIIMFSGFHSLTCIRY